MTLLSNTTVLYYTILYCTALYCILYCSIQCNAIRYDIKLSKFMRFYRKHSGNIRCKSAVTVIISHTYYTYCSVLLYHTQYTHIAVYTIITRTVAYNKIFPYTLQKALHSTCPCVDACRSPDWRCMHWFPVSSPSGGFPHTLNNSTATLSKNK